MKIQNLQAEILYTSEEVSEYLHLSLRTIQRLLQAGTLKSYKIHGQYRIKGLDLLAYLDGVRRDPESPESNARPVQMLDLLKIYPVAIEGAPELVSLFDPVSNPAFIPALQALRKAISLDLGFVMPGVQLSDNSSLSQGQYRICVQGQPVLRGTLALSEEGVTVVQNRLLEELNQVVRQFADEILSREDVFVMVERLRQEHTVLVEEVLSLDGPQTGKITIGQLARILRALLADQISLRNLPLILETLADALEALAQPVQPDYLIEKVRQGLARQLCAPLADDAGIIRVWALEPASEAALLAAFQTRDSHLSTLSRTLQEKLAAQPDSPAVLICSVELRPHLRGILRRNFSHWRVLSYQEIERGYRVELITSVVL